MTFGLDLDPLMHSMDDHRRRMTSGSEAIPLLLKMVAVSSQTACILANLLYKMNASLPVPPVVLNTGECMIHFLCVVWYAYCIVLA